MDDKLLHRLLLEKIPYSIIPSAHSPFLSLSWS